MPGYKGHIVGATVVNGAYVGGLSMVPDYIIYNSHGIVSDWQLLAGLFVLAILFGLFPDIDTNSKGQDIFFGLAFVADILLIVNGRITAAAILGLVAMMPVLGKHRGWTHSKLAMILIPSPLVIIPYLYNQNFLNTALIIYGAAVAGYFSHLLFDGMIWKRIHIKGG